MSMRERFLKKFERGKKVNLSEFLEPVQVGDKQRMAGERALAELYELLDCILSLEDREIISVIVEVPRLKKRVWLMGVFKQRIIHFLESNAMAMRGWLHEKARQKGPFEIKEKL